MDVKQEAFGSTRCSRAERAEFYFEPFCQLAPAFNGRGLFPSMSPMHSWDQMKPRTVYEKAVQDFTETAQQLARLNQDFRQASFAEFKMLIAFDGVLKRYGLPKSMVERALIKVYETVVLDQQR